MGLFSGIGDANLFERGRYMPPGFRGTLKVKKTIAKTTRKSGLAFIVEFEVIEVRQPGEEGHEYSPVVVGEKRTWYQGMNDKDIAFSAIMSWAAALGGYQSHQMDEIKSEVAPKLEEMIETATNSPSDNILVGILVDLATNGIITREKKQPFTVHDWSPCVPGKEVSE